MGCVYRATNIINGKYYIGKTIGPMKVRMQNHFTTGKGNYFHNALEKYGKDSFEWEELFKSDDEQELLKKERLYIKLFHTIAPYGYNITSGGDGGFSVVYTEPQKILMAYKRSLKLSRPVYCVELNRVFASITDATASTGCVSAYIRKICKDPLGKTEKYHFCYVDDICIRSLQDAYMNDILEYGITRHFNKDKVPRNLGKPMHLNTKTALENWRNTHDNPMKGKHQTAASKQKRLDTLAARGKSYIGVNNPAARAIINLDTGDIFDCMVEAEVFYQLKSGSAMNISAVCRGVREHAYGYRWAYYNKDSEESKVS